MILCPVSTFAQTGELLDATDALPAEEQALGGDAPPASDPATAPEADANDPATSSPPSAPPGPPTEGPEVESLVNLSLEELLGLRVRVSVASLFEESGLEVAASADAITPLFWQRRGARRMTDIMNYLPGSVAYPTVWGGEGVAIRSYASSASVRGVAVLLDGVPVNDIAYGSGLYQLGNVELPTLSRMEIIRGPGSAVWGSDAMHGVMSLESYRSGEDRVEAGAQLGTDLFHRGYARASQGIGEAMRVDASVGYSGLPDQGESYTYTDPVTSTAATSERERAYQSFHGSARLTVAPQDRPWDFDLGFHANGRDADEAPGIGRSSGASRSQDLDVSGAQEEFYMARIAGGVDLSRGIRLEASGYYWRLDAVRRSVLGIPDGMGGFAHPEHHQGVATQRGGGRIALRHSIDAIHTRYYLAYELTRFHVDEGSTSYLVWPPPAATTVGPAPYADYTRTLSSIVLSANTALFDDRLALHYGGRLDHYSDFGLQATPRLGLVLQAVPDKFAVKALYSRAFRAPTAAELRGAGNAVRGTDSLRPEIIDSVELVFQAQKDRFMASLTGFGTLWTDGIVGVPLAMPDGPYTSEYANQGENRAAGVELAGTYADERFRVDVSGSYVRSENQQTDLEYTAFPAVIANLGAGYTWRAARLDLYLFQRLMARMSDGAPAPGLSTPDLDPFYQVTFHAGWEAVPAHLWVTLDVRNVFALDNRFPSLWSSEGGIPDMPINASIALEGRL